MKQAVIWTFIIILVLSAIGCKHQITGNTGKPVVYTTIYPLYYMAKEIGKDKVTVTNIIPAGVSVHEWEPSTRDIARLSKADLIIYLGLGLDEWIKKTQSSDVKAIYCEASRNIDLIKDGTAINPHVWLSPKSALIMATNVKDALINMDQADSAYFEKNYQSLKQQLSQLDQEYSKALSSTPRKAFVGYHKAFSYLARDYGLEEVTVIGLDDEQEPSPAQISRVIEYCKANGIKYIFTEPLVTPKPMQTIAAETGAKILTLNPLGGLTQEDIKAGADYISIMHQNLDNLLKALEQ